MLMIHGDILNLTLRDWRDGDFVFANSTCFDDALMLRIADIAGISNKKILIHFIFH